MLGMPATAISLFQSTLPRGERRNTMPRFCDSNIVSIHAPTGGATCCIHCSILLHAVSIHAPTGGATGGNRRGHPSNPVSIHAPTGGATVWRADARQEQGFNPRSHGGSDQWQRFLSIYCSCFNPRSHGGSDVAALGCSHWVRRFQSTLPRGERRENTYTWNDADYVSIHAPTGGATCLQVSYHLNSTVSIHAPTGGATQCCQ